MSAERQNKGFNLAFELEKATKNTYKFSEKAEPGQPARIGSLYVQKWAFGTEDPPKQITVTVQAKE
jgi:hypothetical protein